MRRFLCFIFVSIVSMTVICQAMAESVTLYAVEDAVLNSATPDTNENGDIIRASESVSGDIFNYTYSLIKFDLSSIPDGALITTAKFSWYNFGTTFEAGTTGNYINFRRVENDSWDESSVTWNSQPASPSFLGSASPGTYQTRYDSYFESDDLSFDNWSEAADLADNYLSVLMVPNFTGTMKSYVGYSSEMGEDWGP